MISPTLFRAYGAKGLISAKVSPKRMAIIDSEIYHGRREEGSG